MKFDNAGWVEELVWNLRLADLPRGENRAILQRQFNGDPPFDESEAEENQVQVNRNFLDGVNLLAEARRQWNRSFLKPGNFFSISSDGGPRHKRKENSHKITKHVNRVLRGCRPYKEQRRATGANVMLYGIAPTTWETRRSPIPVPLDVAAVMIPSETLIDFSNLTVISFFREWTPAQLYKLTHGPKRDPGWNMDLVDSQWNYVRDQVQKQPNATAYQYMPERIEELDKQDLGLWSSDAVPTIDVWDTYFRNDKDGDGWYRRIILDWGPLEGALTKTSPKPDHKNKDADGTFIYSSGKRIYSDYLSQFFHSQFADLSAFAPFRYHSVRSLAWMLWGIVDIANRMECKWTESVFEQLMWYFRVASNADMIRLKKANFIQMGVIPQGVDWIKAQDRYAPPAPLMQLAFNRNENKMARSAAAFTQDFDKGPGGKEMTATETMARVNAVNALISGMFTLAYDYEADKDLEVCRRLCIKDSPEKLARKFKEACLKDGVPEEMLDTEKWELNEEVAMGGGNKTLEMAIVQFLQSIRKNLNPDAQRMVDHIAIESTTDDAALAEDLAPVDKKPPVSGSVHDAQLTTERLMRGLQLVITDQMIPEDYVQVWLADLAVMIQNKMQTGGMATGEEIQGFANIAKHVGQFLAIMAQDKEDKARVKKYQDALRKLMNQVKGFAQRLAQQMRKRNGQGAGGLDPKEAAKIQGHIIGAQVKAQTGQQRSAQRMAMDQARFEQDLQQDERRHNAELRQKAQEHGLDLAAEVTKNRLRSI